MIAFRPERKLVVAEIVVNNFPWNYFGTSGLSNGVRPCSVRTWGAGQAR